MHDALHVADSISAHGDVCQNCFRLKQIWVKSPGEVLLQQHGKVMDEMTLKHSLCSHEHEGRSDGHNRAISLEDELICLQKHQQEMSATMEKVLCSLVEQQKLLTKEEEAQHLKQQQEITKLKAQVTELEEKNQILLEEKRQLIEVRH